MHESIDVRWREQHRLVLLDEGFDSLAARIAENNRRVKPTLASWARSGPAATKPWSKVPC